MVRNLALQFGKAVFLAPQDGGARKTAFPIGKAVFEFILYDIYTR